MIRQIFRVFFVIFVLLGFISVAVSLMIAGWTNYSNFAIKITDPMVCPSNTTARVDVIPSSFYWKDGISYNSVGNDFNCVNSKGDIVAKKTTEQKNLWNLLLPISCIILVAVFSLLIAISIGIIYKRKGIIPNI